VSVSDTGTGIAAEDVPKVFDRFYCGDASRSKTSVAGTGLGLSICRSIIEAHSGRIDLQSRINEGTVVTVVLPAGHADDAAAPEAEGGSVIRAAGRRWGAESPP